MPLSGSSQLKGTPKIQLPGSAPLPPIAVPKDTPPPPDIPPAAAAPAVPTLQTPPPTLEQVQQAWDAFAEYYKQNNKPLIASMLTWQKVSFQYPVITHALRTNATDADAFKDVRSELLGFLKKHLNDNRLELATVEVDAIEAEPLQKIYTNTDKFNFLAAQNPLLNELRNLLGLDIE